MLLITLLRSLFLTFGLLATPFALAEKPPQYEEPVLKDLQQFVALYTGEFDNYTQVYFEENGFLEQVPEEKHSRIYQSRHRVNAPELGELVLYEETHSGENLEKLYRQRIVLLETEKDTRTIKTRHFALKQPERYRTQNHQLQDFSDLKPNDLTALGQDCGTVWRKSAAQFIGRIESGRCKIASKHQGKTRFILFDGVVAENEYWALEGGIEENGDFAFGRKDGIAYQYRRATPYTCWVAVKNERDEWDFFQNLRVLDQGGKGYFQTSDQVPKQYYLQLKETVFPAGKRPDVFELFIHEAGNPTALSYVWTKVGSDRIGINLRWMQGSCSK